MSGNNRWRVRGGRRVCTARRLIRPRQSGTTHFKLEGWELTGHSQHRTRKPDGAITEAYMVPYGKRWAGRGGGEVGVQRLHFFILRGGRLHAYEIVFM
mgnify:CR=1 FL=1